MKEKIFTTNCGDIHYWTNEIKANRKTLIFLPGLTADHRLFEKQIEYFENKNNIIVWDAPCHASSWPFKFDYDLFDKAKWLDNILCLEEISMPIIVGQSMGGYVAQAYSELFHEKLGGFIAVDSAPLQRKFVSAWEIFILKHMEPFYKYYPWKLLHKAGAEGVAVTEYGKSLMYSMINVYNNSQERYAKISGHGFKMLANAMEADLQYKINCPALILCGDKDKAGFCKRYAKAWSNDSGIKLIWIENAGHNSNTDRPEIVNKIIDEFVNR